MKTKRLALLLLACALIASLPACGNKGSLVRPAPTTDAGDKH